MALVALSWLLFTFVVKQPSNDRDWEIGFETLPSITLDADVLTVRNLRDFRTGEDAPLRSRFVDRSVDVRKIERAWFLVEPFQVLPIEGFRGVAHTYFVFDVAVEPPIAVSVEARRERGERYNAGVGLFNEYELMYVWATEEDQTVRRVVERSAELHMYPLRISRESVVHLVKQLARSSAELEQEARFYNTFTSNCTNELAKNANSLQPGAIPTSIAWWLPGYSVDQLYDLGYIPNDRPLVDIERRYDITDIVRQIHHHPDFSKRLRSHLDR
jgi:hypothetical protein